jgi:hypothetical protein
MGDAKEALSTMFVEQANHDSVFLSYSQKIANCVYFPKSTYGYGRMALYVTGRLMEVAQGWLYDYYIFTDDDPVLTVGSLANFESDLRLWRVC